MKERRATTTRRKTSSFLPESILLNKDNRFQVFGDIRKIHTAVIKMNKLFQRTVSEETVTIFQKILKNSFDENDEMCREKTAFGLFRNREKKRLLGFWIPFYAEQYDFSLALQLARLFFK